MRVAYICADPGVPVYGQKGCSIHVQEMIRALTARGARVELFAANTEGTSAPDLGSIALQALPHPRGRDARARERAALLANGSLRLALERRGPFDLIYERHSLWSVAGMRFARDHAIPGVLEVNAPLVEEQAEHRTLCDSKTALLASKEAFEAAPTIVAVSRGAAGYVERLIGATTKLHVVPNGVDPRRFQQPPAPRHRHGSGEGAFTIGFVGSLKPWHGLPTLTEAFAALHASDRRLRLLIVGDGPERTPTEAWLATRGLSDASRFTGAVPPDQIPRLLASMDGAVAPYASRPDFYFSPLKVFEYMAAGLPVVASRMGQIEEVITDGETGLLCAPDDPADLAKHLRRLCDDGDLCLRLGSAARAVVATRHTWHAVADRILVLAGLRVPMEARP